MFRVSVTDLLAESTLRYWLLPPDEEGGEETGVGVPDPEPDPLPDEPEGELPHAASRSPASSAIPNVASGRPITRGPLPNQVITVI